MAEYKIEPRASGTSITYFVRKALGPWPLKNWSLTPCYTTYSYADAERWIKDTQFTESPEGQLLARQKEAETKRRRELEEEHRQAMAREGWIWCPATMLFRHHKTGEYRT